MRSGYVIYRTCRCPCGGDKTERRLWLVKPPGLATGLWCDNRDEAYLFERIEEPSFFQLMFGGPNGWQETQDCLKRIRRMFPCDKLGHELVTVSYKDYA